MLVGKIVGQAAIDAGLTDTPSDADDEDRRCRWRRSCQPDSQTGPDPTPPGSSTTPARKAPEIRHPASTNWRSTANRRTSRLLKRKNDLPLSFRAERRIACAGKGHEQEPRQRACREDNPVCLLRVGVRRVEISGERLYLEDSKICLSLDGGGKPATSGESCRALDGGGNQSRQELVF